VLQVGAHPSVALTSQQSDPLPPLSVADKYRGEREPSETGGSLEHWRVVNDEFKLPDAPFVTTLAATAKTERPYLPGGGLRGPLRQTASRLQRARKEPDGRATLVRDPNWKDDPLGSDLQKASATSNCAARAMRLALLRSRPN